MARISQPLEVAELKGLVKKNPQRYQKIPVKNEQPFGDPPTHLRVGARKIWKELEEYALPGVLTKTERLIFELLVNLVYEYRKKPDAFVAAKHNVMERYMAKLGWNPADRQKFSKPPENALEDDSFDEFFQ